ncbi:MAG: hypothetical protein R3F34_18985 [Planctomycetota bacterium]
MMLADRVGAAGVLGEVDAFGVRLVVDLDTQAAYELAPEPSRLVLPSVAMLEKPGAEIPWDPYLH